MLANPGGEQTTMQGADAIARILQLEGVEYLFSYPNHPLIDAAARLGIRPIIARGEKTLINIADGFCRANNGRSPAVIVVQAGPGIENAFGALAQAFADSVPLLIIPGGPDQHRLGEPPEFDPLPPYKHITKWAGRLNFTERIPELMRRSFGQLRNGKPGPVLLELPRDVGNGELDASVSDYTQAWDELRQLAELVQAPVMTTMAAKSVFPENHPLSVGASGHTITRTAAHFLVRSDLVFGIGCSFARGGFSAPIPAGTKMVQITLDSRDIDKDYQI